MPKLQFTQDEIDNYTKEKYFHGFHKKTMEIAEEMCVHADGLFPQKLLYTRRPNEPQEVMDYRKLIFSANTKPTFSKILSSLQKIRRSADWSIRFTGEFPKIREGETLEDYTEYNYPGFTSVTNWVFTLMLRKYLIDPNAVVMVKPMETEVEQTNFVKPIAQVFDSADVIDFVDEDFAVLVHRTGATYVSGGKLVKGKRYYVCTTMQILTYDQVDGRMRFSLVGEYNHNLGVLPVFKLKGTLIDQVDNNYLYESKIAGIIPELNEAIREYSDLQAAKVLHIYPERWEVTQNECLNCKGTRLRPNPAYTGPGCGCEAQIACDKCNNGYVVSGPYSKILVKPAGMGEQNITTPPAGYVEKDVDIVEIMDKGVDAHIYKALAAINFEFLAKIPLAESGVAKEVDKDELNNMVHGIAEDLVSAMDNIYWLIALYRYVFLYSKEDISEMVPSITVPEKYDMLSSDHLQVELKTAKESKFNPVLINALEKEYASKKFNTDPGVSDMVQLILSLDPLPNISEDDKMSRLSNKGITQETYVISSNIQEFVRRAIAEDETFPDKKPEEQNKIIVKFAAEVMSEEDIEMPEDTGLDEAGQVIPDQVTPVNQPITEPANA